MAFTSDDRLVGNEGVAIIDTSPGTPITLDVLEWSFEKKPEFAKGRTTGNRATGRTLLGIDWEVNIAVRVPASGTTPGFLRDGTTTGFDLRTDAAGSPAVKVVGSGIVGNSRVRAKVDEYIEYSIQILCSDPDETNLPTITYA